MKYPLVIPYYNIKKFEILKGDNVVQMFEPEYTIKTNDIAKNTMIGAMVGDTTGAIIGASASLPKKVMTSPTRFYNVDFYKVNFEFKENMTLQFELFAFNKADYEFLQEEIVEINSKLLNSKYTSKNLRSADEVNKILDEYIGEYKKIIDNSIDYKKRKYCINYIYNNISDEENIYLYCSKEEFVKKLYNILNNVKEKNF